jgi:hypothetical protein
MSALTIRSQQLAMAAVRHRLPSAGTGAAQAGDLSQGQALVCWQSAQEETVCRSRRRIGSLPVRLSRPRPTAGLGPWIRDPGSAIAAGWAWESLAGIDSQVNAVR